MDQPHKAMKVKESKGFKPPIEKEEEIDTSNSPRVFLKFFLHTAAMFTLPFVAYFRTRSYIIDDLLMTKQQGFIYGAVAAVVVVHFIIGSYIYQAFAEESKQKLQ